MTYRPRQDRNVFVLFVFVAFSVLLAPLPHLTKHALAQRVAPYHASFEHLDRNGDGFIDRVEARGVPGLPAAFRMADANDDGGLDRGEYARALELTDAQR